MSDKLTAGLPKDIAAAVRAFARTLRVPRVRSLHPVILAPFGPSCVGKTSVMKAFARRIPVVHIQHDAIRLALRARGIDENAPLYRYKLAIRLAERFLARNYSVIIDANFATRHDHVRDAKLVAKRTGSHLHLIRVIAPASFIMKKLRHKIYLPTDRGGLFPDAATAIAHFRRSSEQQANNYIRLSKNALAVIDSSKPLSAQLRNPVRQLCAEMHPTKN
jgi:predicted kinase